PVIDAGVYHAVSTAAEAEVHLHVIRELDILRDVFFRQDRCAAGNVAHQGVSLVGREGEDTWNTLSPWEKSTHFNVKVISDGLQNLKVGFTLAGLVHADGTFCNTKSIRKLLLCQIVELTEIFDSRSCIGHVITS